MIAAGFKHNKRYSYKNFTKRDIPSLVELERQAFPLDHWDEGVFMNIFSNTNSSLKVILCQKRIIGYICIEISEMTKKGDKVTVGEISSLAVAADHKGKGLGVKLLRHGIQQLSKTSSTTVQMQTRLDNLAMKSLAERKFGFKTTKIKKNFYRDGSSAYEMTLSL